ncbi:MAG: phytanoyl-CoA dioxygenase family protein [Planctomycetota bacterium]|jgi:ectoine hydroxylase-related dioxygenase (phytanoyl-CoA dioxygenase family)|nr:phytanoyl-CoA dioxygenase family protein [Planctomycetota bacterium]
MQMIQIGQRLMARAAIGTLKDSGPQAEPAQLRQRLADDGYLLLRGVLDRSAVLAARERVLAFAADNAQVMGNTAITHDPTVLAVLESEQLRHWFAALFACPVITTDYKWLRIMERGGCTGAHVDRVYMGRGSERLTTSWISLGDTPMQMGGLALLEQSHRCASLQRLRATYGQMDVDRDRVSGWFSDDPEELQSMSGTRWLSADYRAGDVLVFGMDMVHMSTTQDTDASRVTCDVRWQPASDPCDERWFGSHQRGHYAWHSGATEPMAAARARWGV